QVIGRRVEAEADRRGFQKPSPEGTRPGRHLDFLEPLPSLLADQERRAAEKGRAAPADRIPALIAALDEVNARQFGQPGGVDLGSDSRVQALVEVGDAAVEPLLDVLERDTRLTRSVHFWRDFSHHRSLLGVHEAAYVALA